MNLSLGIAEGAWETALTLDHEDHALSRAQSQGERSAAYQAVIGDSGDVAVSCNYSRSADWETRMVCVNADGKTTVIPENSAQVSTVQAGGILLVSSDEFARIKMLQLQQRRYRLVEFSNVSLQPGYATTVGIRDAGGE